MDKKIIAFFVILIIVVLILLIGFAGPKKNKKKVNETTPNFHNISNIISGPPRNNGTSQKSNFSGPVFDRPAPKVNEKIYFRKNGIITSESITELSSQSSYVKYSTPDDEVIDVTPFLPAQFTTSLTGDDWKDSRNRSKPESICKKTLQKIYGVKFSTVRPKWLRNPLTNRPMELDCYNDECKVAVEYNGVQHYKWPNFTRQTKQQWLDQVERDRLKVDICDKNDVYLITVPYNIPHDLIPDYINYYLPHNVERRQKFGMDE